MGSLGVYLREAVRKDLVRRLRDPAVLAIWLGIPLVLGTLITAVSSGGGSGRLRAKVLVVDQDGTFASELLTGVFQQGPAEGLFEARTVELEEGRALLDEGEASALLVIPAGFSEALFEEVPATLELVTNPAQRILPGLVEETLNLQSSDIMYVGDHVEADVHVTKSMLRWRTALVLRELEEEFVCLKRFKQQQAELSKLMREKEQLEKKRAWLRLQIQRSNHGYGPRLDVPLEEIHLEREKLSKDISILDEHISPLAKASQMMFNSRWGLLTRAGYDKSYLARQLEGYADIYMSRVSNFLYQTPFAYLRSTRSSLPHDGGVIGNSKV